MEVLSHLRKTAVMKVPKIPESPEVRSYKKKVSWRDEDSLDRWEMLAVFLGTLVGLVVVNGKPERYVLAVIILAFCWVIYPVMKRHRADQELRFFIGTFLGVIVLAACCRVLFAVIY
jgi:uncharacterized metal-binding protein